MSVRSVRFLKFPEAKALIDFNIDDYELVDTEYDSLFHSKPISYTYQNDEEKVVMVDNGYFIIRKEKNYDEDVKNDVYKGITRVEARKDSGWNNEGYWERLAFCFYTGKDRTAFVSLGPEGIVVEPDFYSSLLLFFDRDNARILKYDELTQKNEERFVGDYPISRIVEMIYERIVGDNDTKTFLSTFKEAFEFIEPILISGITSIEKEYLSDINYKVWNQYSYRQNNDERYNPSVLDAFEDAVGDIQDDLSDAYDYLDKRK